MKLTKPYFKYSVCILFADQLEIPYTYQFGIL